MAITIISNREDYLDRIARREFAPSKNNPIALGVLAESIEHATTLTWALRQPLAAEGQMHEALTDAARRHATPAFALMFSCIGRGPLFYGDDDLSHDEVVAVASQTN